MLGPSFNTSSLHSHVQRTYLMILVEFIKLVNKLMNGQDMELTENCPGHGYQGRRSQNESERCF